MTQKPIWLSKYGNVFSHVTKGPELGQVPESVDSVAQFYHGGPLFFLPLSSASPRTAVLSGRSSSGRNKMDGARWLQHVHVWQQDRQDPRKKETTSPRASLGWKQFS